MVLNTSQASQENTCVVVSLKSQAWSKSTLINIQIKCCQMTVLKACVRYFLWNFYFHQTIVLYKLRNIFFLFHLKSSFCSGDIQIYVFSSSPLFLPVSHCFTDWSKKKLKVYDVINGLNKNLITHLVWYLEKEVSCDFETLSIDRVLNKENFYKTIIQKMCTKR